MNILGDLRRESPRIGNCQCLKVLTIFIPKQGLLSNFHSLCFILIYLQTISVALNIFIGIIFIVFFFFLVWNLSLKWPKETAKWRVKMWSLQSKSANISACNADQSLAQRDGYITRILGFWALVAGRLSNIYTSFVKS